MIAAWPLKSQQKRNAIRCYSSWKIILGRNALPTRQTPSIVSKRLFWIMQRSNKFWRSMYYSNSRNSSSVRPLCLRRSARGPFARAECMGTTVRKTISAVRFSKETWLPFCRSSTKPAGFHARITRSPETLGSFATSRRNFDGSPEFLRFDRPVFRRAPGFQIQFDGLAQISASSFDIVALRSNTQFWTAGDVKVFLFGDQYRESVSHMAMLALPA